MNLNTTVIATVPPPPPSAAELRTRHLQRRHRLPPAIAATLAELAFASSPSWRGGAPS